jgi:hypothetical protein
VRKMDVMLNWEYGTLIETTCEGQLFILKCLHSHNDHNEIVVHTSMLDSWWTK